MQLSIRHTVHTLSNGLKLFIHEDRRTPIACVNVWYFVGSKNERPGRTGFAHLFEHLMFEGSKHVAKGQFDELLENAGGTNNGSTSNDRTNYWETVPSGAVELALYLESDRMGWFLETITQEKLDGQREVVKNERRQSYDNRPYGLAYETITSALYQEDHPYHWPVIGWMRDLDAATLNDVREFFQIYYAPNNAALAIAGDVDTAEMIELVEKHFGGIGQVATPSAPVVPASNLGADKYLTIEDDVHLPRLYLAWHTPAFFQPGDAELDVAADVLGAGKAARLYSELVHDRQIAQDVDAYQNSGQLGSSLMISVTARENVGLRQIETEIRRILSDVASGLTERELKRAHHHTETATADALQSVGGFGGKADRLNHYYYHTGDPDYLSRDLARYQVLTVDSVRAHTAHVLAQPGVVLSVVPTGRADLAARGVA